MKQEAQNQQNEATAARTEIVFILDRSGSMNGRETDVIEGFNAMIAEQRRKPGVCRVSAVLFDDVAEVLFNRVPVAEVPRLTEERYRVRGCTAYYDALGRGIVHHVRVQRHLRPEERAEKVLFVVMTDDHENASREFDGVRLRRLIREEQEKWGWEFVFIGAGIDAIDAARRIGIRADRAINTCADGTGIRMSYTTISSAITNIRARRDLAVNRDGTSYRTRIDQDYQTRHRR